MESEVGIENRLFKEKMGNYVRAHLTHGYLRDRTPFEASCRELQELEIDLLPQGNVIALGHERIVRGVLDEIDRRANSNGPDHASRS